MNLFCCNFDASAMSQGRWCWDTTSIRQMFALTRVQWLGTACVETTLIVNNNYLPIWVLLVQGRWRWNITQCGGHFSKRMQWLGAACAETTCQFGNRQDELIAIICFQESQKVLLAYWIGIALNQFWPTNVCINHDPSFIQGRTHLVRCISVRSGFGLD